MPLTIEILRQQVIEIDRLNALYRKIITQSVNLIFHSSITLQVFQPDPLAGDVPILAGSSGAAASA